MLLMNEKGSALVMVMMFTLILTILGTSVLAVTMNEYRMEKAYRDSVASYYLAEAGLEKAIYDIAEMENIGIGLVSQTWEMDADEQEELLKPGTNGNYKVSVENVKLDDTIYVDEQQTVVYKKIYIIILKSNASVDGMTRKIEAGIRVEDYEASGIENKVEILYWHQLR
jgi:Tfp pilus assembly protein PilX